MGRTLNLCTMISGSMLGMFSYVQANKSLFLRKKSCSCSLRFSRRREPTQTVLFGLPSFMATSIRLLDGSPCWIVLSSLTSIPSTVRVSFDARPFKEAMLHF